MAVFFPLILFFTAVLSKPNKSDPLIPSPDESQPK